MRRRANRGLASRWSAMPRTATGAPATTRWAATRPAAATRATATASATTTTVTGREVLARLVPGEMHILGHQLRRNRAARNGVSDVFFNVRQALRIVLAAEADGVAFGAGTRRAADAMHIVGAILRQVEIEHVTHVRNVQSA